jgi:hypothetical protein
MKDDFEATFVVDLAPDEVWEALTRRTVDGDDATSGEKHYVLPGFPSFPPLSVVGASCTTIEEEAGRLLRVKKDHHPCAGTEIAVRLEQAATGTRVTVVQSGFGPFLDIVGRDTVFSHGSQIIADFRLYLERGVTVPGTAFGRNLGARVRQTPVGLELTGLDPKGFAESAGMRTGDLLLTLAGIRLHDVQQLSTVLALTDAGSSTEATWARGREPMGGKALFAA